MTDTQMRSFMQDFFEQYYQRLGQDGDGIALLRPLEESDRAMWREDADPDEEWKVWKLIPSTVTDQDIEKLETDIGAKLPRCLRAFLTVYHHYFDGPVGVNPISAPFEAVRNAWNPLLVKHGYLPFTWDDDGYYIRCMDLANMPDEERGIIMNFDRRMGERNYGYKFQRGPLPGRNAVSCERRNQKAESGTSGLRGIHHEPDDGLCLRSKRRPL